MSKKPYYITTAIYYPSNYFHLGNAYTTLIAETLKRFKTAQGYDVFFTTGTDEHGQKLYDTAKAHGLAPLEYIDPIVRSARELWEKLDIHYDAFVRSSDPVHEKNAQTIFQKLLDKGEIYKGTYKGHYCVPCESFWTSAQLEDGKCPDCGREVQYREEESYFFRLSAYRDRLLKYYDEHPQFIKPDYRKNEMVNNFLKEELEDLSITRTAFDWGVPVPGDDKHILYVWIDALTCYLTGVGFGVDEQKFNHYWPAAVHLVGKEIMRFHAIIWPALLMALDIPIPEQIFGHGWILFDEDKMSKSKGNIVYPEPIVDLYGLDALKYFILREFTFGMDGNFTKKRLLERINADLVNDLGNLVSRTLAMVESYFGGQLPAPSTLEAYDEDLSALAVSIKAEVDKEMETFQFSKALEAIWKLIRRTNKYIDETEPWVLAKTDKERLGTVLYYLVESIRIISVLIHPFLTQTSEKIGEKIQWNDFSWESAVEFGKIKPGIRVTKGDNLFNRLDVDKEILRLEKANQELLDVRLYGKEKKSCRESCACHKPQENLKSENKECAIEEKEKKEISIEDFDKVELKVGRILSCEKHPKADKLLVFTVDLGSEKRTIVSGIRQWYSEDDLIGKNVVVCTNLKPVKLRGVESNGMILAAQDGDHLSVLTTLQDIERGAEIS